MVLAGLVSILVSTADAQSPTSFTRASEVRSPDGRLVLQNQDTDTGHFLFLRNVKTNTSEQILSYGRHASALWAPDSHGFVVNDYGGSDYSKCLIFRLDGDKRPIDLDDEIERLALSPSVAGNHHVYVECVQWLSPNSLKVKIGGYGDTDLGGFTLYYEYKPGGPFRLLKRINTYPVK